jgi:hypothetical protein
MLFFLPSSPGALGRNGITQERMIRDPRRMSSGNVGLPIRIILGFTIRSKLSNNSYLSSTPINPVHCGKVTPF